MQLSAPGGGGGGLPLAPDLTYPADKQAIVIYTNVSGIDASAGLTTLLSLTGKFSIASLLMTSLTANDIAQVRLTVDGIIIWNVDPVTNSASEAYIGGGITAANIHGLEDIRCESSFLFEMETDADTSIAMTYIARPLL